MNKKHFQTKSNTLRRKLRSTIAVLLSIFLATGAMPLSAIYIDGADAFALENHLVTLTEEQLSAFEEVQEFTNSISGVVDFDNFLPLPGQEDVVPVIVFFESHPASTQVIEAAVEGFALPLQAAMEIVEDEHATFRRELANLFGSGSGIQAFSASVGYSISAEFRYAMNGVAMTLPIDMLEAVAELDVVRAVLPDYPILQDSVIEHDFDEFETQSFVSFSGIMPASGPVASRPGEGGLLSDAWGMLPGRLHMNAHRLHEQGVDGTGILVGVIDSGVEWMNPVFAGSFPPAEVINQARLDRFGPGGTAHPPGSFITDDPRARPLWDGTNNPGGYNELLNINVYDFDMEDPTDPAVLANPNRRLIGHPRHGEAPNYVFAGRDIQRLWPGGRGDSVRTNPLRPGGSPSNREFPIRMPVGMPGPNPFEMHPLYFVVEGSAVSGAGSAFDMRHRPEYAYIFHGVIPGSNIDGWQNHGTHVHGTIVGRPYGDDGGRTLMGVAPGAWGAHYRLQDGQGFCSSMVASIEWAFLDGMNAINISIGRWGGSQQNIRSLAINNVMLADPTIVFTISAGNSGAEGYFSMLNPASTTMGISVAAFNAIQPGVLIQSPTLPGVTQNGIANVGRTSWSTLRDAGRLIEYGNTGNFIINHPTSTITHDNGVYRIFPMDGGAPVGTGTQAQFDALLALHTPAALEGHFVLVSRGETQANLVTRATAAGLGGVIVINNPGTAAPQQSGVPAAAGGIHNVSILTIMNEEGVVWANNIVKSPAAYSTFTITGHPYIWDLGPTGGLMPPNTMTSRGPLNESFHIKPDLGSHGGSDGALAGGIFSAAVRHAGGWRTTGWEAIHRTITGTSMSAPHMAGAVALLQHYSATNGGQAPFSRANMWPNYEVKTRLMNTANDLVTGRGMCNVTGLISPFEGARQVDVWRATQTNTVVFAEDTRIATMPLVPISDARANLATTLTGAFHFGGFNRAASGNNPRHIGAGGTTYTIYATIRNNSSAAITYTLTSEFLVNRPTAPLTPPELTLPLSALGGAQISINFQAAPQITVNANSEVRFPVTITIPPASANPQAAATRPGASVGGLGSHEGFITVTGGNEEIVMPFAAVAYYLEPSFVPLGLYRPVVTTNRVEDGAQNVTSNELVLYFEQNDAFYLDLILVCGEIVNAPGFTGDNWFEFTLMPDGSNNYRFGDYILGATMETAYHYRFGRHFGRFRGVAEGPLRGVIFDGYYFPYFWDTMEAGRTPEEREASRRRLDREGDFFIGIHVHRQVPVTTGGAVHQLRLWFYEDSFLIPFSVDNTPAEFTSITVNDIPVELTDANVLTVDLTANIGSNAIAAMAANLMDVVITGSVHDEWLTSAIDRNLEFGVWNIPREACYSENIALWVLIGENTPSNRPQRAEIDADGSFLIVFEDALDKFATEETEITFWLIDGYAPVPVINQVGLGTNETPIPPPQSGPQDNILQARYWNTPARYRRLADVAEYFAFPGGLVRAEDVEADLRHDLIFGRAPATHPSGTPANNFNAQHTAVLAIPAEDFTHFAWSGLNVNELSITVNLVPTFGLQIFNNGPDGSPSIPNASLAEAGLIRIWTQLNGIGTPIPSTNLTVTAEFPDGTNAMEFVRVNHMWEKPGYVNLIDVSKHAPWQTIILTATMNDQEVEATLVNSRFLGLRAYNNGTDAEVPSMAGNIRIWPLLAGNPAPIPMNAVITAVDQSGNNAMAFVTANRQWCDTNGWLNYNVNFDVTKDAPWETITFTVTVYGQTVTILLINDWFNAGAAPVLSLIAFNNGTDLQVPGMAGNIRIWPQLDGIGAPIPMNAMVTAVDQNGADSMAFVRTNRLWDDTIGWRDYNVNFDVTKDAPWATITFSVTAHGQTYTVLLINDWFVAP